MALLCALPMLLLPVTVARVFGRARAGLAMLALPVLMWLANGTVLTGTEYGLADRVSSTRVYALYGLPASLMFLSLVLVAYAVTRRPACARRSPGRWRWSCWPRAATCCGRCRAWASRWWSPSCGGPRGRVGCAGSWPARPPRPASSSRRLPGVAMDRINESRDRVVLAESSRLPDAHRHLAPALPRTVLPLTDHRRPLAVRRGVVGRVGLAEGPRDRPRRRRGQRGVRRDHEGPLPRRRRRSPLARPSAST